jgi:hypothetical protein
VLVTGRRANVQTVIVQCLASTIASRADLDFTDGLIAAGIDKKREFRGVVAAEITGDD